MLLWPARIFLLINLILHVSTASWLTIENRKARGQQYSFKDTVQASYASRTMMMSGGIVFVFIVYHLLHFTFGITNPGLFHLHDAKGRIDVYTMVVSSYQNLGISAVYVVAMALLCMHLSHGLSSLFQSLGLSHAKFRTGISLFSKGMALLIFVGNSSIPVAVLLRILHVA